IGETTDTHFDRQMPVGVTIEWFIVAFVPGCSGIESDHSTFSIPAPLICDNRGPVLNTPVEGSSQSANPLKFSWTAVPRAVGYKLTIIPSSGIPSLAASGPATEAVVQV